MKFRKLYLGGLLAIILALSTVQTTHAQIGVNVQNGFKTCFGADCDNSLVLGATTTTNGSELHYATITMTNAEAVALHNTSKTIVAAPGAGKMVEILGGLIVFDYTATYTETGGDDNIRLYYGDSGKEPASPNIEMTGFVDATADAVIKFGPVANDQVIQGAEMSNTAVVLSGSATGTHNNWGGGDSANVFRIIVAYRIVSTGL